MTKSRKPVSERDNSPTVLELEKELNKLADPAKAKFLQRFFKTGPGQYGEGDRFLGINVPALRAIAKKYNRLPIDDCIVLLQSPYHEKRLTALLILAAHFKKGDDQLRRKIKKLYLQHTSYINSWDLVDLSAPGILGPTISDYNDPTLSKLANSGMLWERRMAILATHYLIKQGKLEETYRIADMLLNDEHDLIQKAVGWMLRETGKKDTSLLISFLKTRYRRMPRTMLRYSIEKFPPLQRKMYLQGEV